MEAWLWYIGIVIFVYLLDREVNDEHGNRRTHEQRTAAIQANRRQFYYEVGLLISDIRAAWRRRGERHGSPSGTRED